MTKLIFDTQIYDLILETDLFKDLIQLKSNHEIEYLMTHVQVDEIAAIPDSKMEKRKKLFLFLLQLRPQIIPTIGTIFGVSRLGFTTFASEENSQRIDEVRRLNKELNPSRDSLIVVTALGSADIYVSNDRRRNNIVNKIIEREKLNTKLMDFDEFHRYVKKKLVLET